ncbi:mitochondrial ribonuclease P catalytic subunit [Palaemon carinicauda]|uniref:mitochondrial ribonuclease P catalytic subunit n=1 Tax=Palaemon carinicauda TaxID=392227 RepID=UPI0035B6337E
MAKHIQFIQKIQLLPTNFRAPSSCFVPRRFISHNFLLCEKSKTRGVLRQHLIERPVKFDKAVVHQICKSFHSTLSDDPEEEISDSEGEGNHIVENDKLTMIFKSKTSLSNQKWSEVFDLMLDDKRFKNVSTFDSLVMKLCLRHENWELACSYFEYLEVQEKEPNLMSLAYFLQLCGNKVDKCGEEKVLEVYRKLTSKAKIFDVTLSENACLALARTSQWKEALKYMPIFKKLCSVPARVYNAIISAAFRNGEYDTGWQFLEALSREEKELFCSTVMDYIKCCQSAENKEGMVDTLLHKFSQFEIFPKVLAAEELMRFFRDEVQWSGRYVKIFNDGVCPACSHQLDATEIDVESFLRLKEEYVSRVLIGSDIFKNTDPEEWSRFKTFVDEEGPFSIVMDGLNVAYSVGKKTSRDRMRRLREAVTKLKLSNRKGSIMVIGRKHMMSWSPGDLEALKKRAKVFTLDNISKDDGFFIYAALQSGLGTQFVSSDFLRDHVYRLKDHSLRETFRTWQRKHQIFSVSHPSGVHLVPPPKFRAIAQKQDSLAWHIPYNDGSLKESFEVPYTWLCLHQDQQKHEGSHSRKLVSEVAFECVEEDKFKPFYVNPKKFGIDSNNSNLNFITVNDEIPGSKQNDSRMLNIKYGKVSLNSDRGILQKQSLTYDNARMHSRDSAGRSGSFRNSSKEFKSSSESSQSTSKYEKGIGARNKMKQDMMTLIGGNIAKQKRLQYNKRHSMDKEKNEKVVVKDLFKSDV